MKTAFKLKLAVRIKYMNIHITKSTVIVSMSFCEPHRAGVCGGFKQPFTVDTKAQTNMMSIQKRLLCNLLIYLSSVLQKKSLDEVVVQRTTN